MDKLEDVCPGVIKWGDGKYNYINCVSQLIHSSSHWDIGFSSMNRFREGRADVSQKQDIILHS
jgi:hypothetical protein